MTKLTTLNLFSTESGVPIQLSALGLYRLFGKRERDEEALQKQWGKGLRYRGHDLLNLSCQINPDDRTYDGQESYFGYLVDSDMFLSGHDGWGYLFVSINDAGRIEIEKEIKMVDGNCDGDDEWNVYPDNINRWRETYVDLLDLRLD
jgi:hypothetical protein